MYINMFFFSTNAYLQMKLHDLEESKVCASFYIMYMCMKLNFLNCVYHMIIKSNMSMA
jgi:hypothetical protein